MNKKNLREKEGVKNKIIKIIRPEKTENKTANHFWKDKSLLGYIRRAYFSQLIVLVMTIGLYTNVHTGETVPGDFPEIVIKNAAYVYGLILVYHFYKVKKISYPKYDPDKIPSIPVGAVSVIAAFFGVFTTLLISVLLLRGEIYDAIEEIIILMLMFCGWMFVVLTYKFSEVCYFYYQWDKKRSRS